jgi:hypothetical protein
MRTVQWTDKDGHLRASLVRDFDPDTAAPRGIPVDPPDLRGVDVEGAMRDLHNELVRRGLMTWLDVQRSGDGVSASILSAFKRRVIALYRQSPDEPGTNKEN